MKQRLLITSIFITSSLMAMESDPETSTESVLVKRKYRECALAPSESLPHEYAQLSGTWRNLLQDRMVVADSPEKRIAIADEDMPAFQLLRQYFPLALAISRQRDPSLERNQLSEVLRKNLQCVTTAEVPMLKSIAAQDPSLTQSNKKTIEMIKLGMIANISNQLDISIIAQECLKIFYSTLNNDNTKNLFLNSQNPDEFNPFYLDKDVLRVLTRTIIAQPLRNLLLRNKTRIPCICITSDTPHAHTDRISALQYHAASGTIITGSKDTTVKLWTYKPKLGIALYQKTIITGDTVGSLMLCPHNNSLILWNGCLHDKSVIQIWDHDADSKSWAPIQTIKESGYSLELSVDGTAFSSTYFEGSVLKKVIYKQDAGTNQWVKQDNLHELPNKHNTPQSWVEESIANDLADHKFQVIDSNKIAVVSDRNIDLHEYPASLQKLYEHATIQQALLLLYAQRNLLNTYPNLSDLCESLDEGELKGSGVLDLVIKLIREGDIEKNSLCESEDESSDDDSSQSGRGGIDL